MKKYCPICMSADTKSLTGDGWVCMDSSHGTEGFAWTPAPEPTTPQRKSRKGTTSSRQPVVSDIGEKLLSCIPPGPDFTPYGTVEDRFFELWPMDADALLQKYGHKWRNEGVRTGRYAMSMYLAHGLSRLERQSLAEHINARPDPMFNEHLDEYGHWRLPQAEDRHGDTSGS
jgi:hypothetical protein